MERRTRWGAEETLGSLDAEGLNKGAHVDRSKVLGALLGTLVDLPLMEGAVDTLGSSNLMGAEDTLGALEVEGPNRGT